jgi:hypothetical protein
MLNFIFFGNLKSIILIVKCNCEKSQQCNIKRKIYLLYSNLVRCALIISQNIDLLNSLDMIINDDSGLWVVVNTVYLFAIRYPSTIPSLMPVFFALKVKGKMHLVGSQQYFQDIFPQHGSRKHL